MAIAGRILRYLVRAVVAKNLLGTEDADLSSPDYNPPSYPSARIIPAQTVDTSVNQTAITVAAADPFPPRVIPVHLWFPPAGETITKLQLRPLLLFFPGWGDTVTANATLLRTLAEQGFVVAGISYPQGKGLPDPKIPMQFTSDAAFACGRAQGDRMVQIQAQDASRVMDVLLAPDGWPVQANERLDPKRIGVLGYSLGGAMAAQTALRDARVRAVMNLDGWMFGDAVTERFSQPYLVISDGLEPATQAEMDSSDAFLHHFARLRHSDRLVQDAQLRYSGGWRVTILGSDHFTFRDEAVKGAPGTGTIDPPRARELAARYAAEFFGRYLQGKPAPLLEGKSPFPETRVEIFP